MVTAGLEAAGVVALLVLVAVVSFVLGRRLHARTAASQESRLEMLTGVIENSQALTFVKDLQGHYLYVSDVMLDEAGRTRDEMVGHRIDLFGDPVLTAVSQHSDEDGTHGRTQVEVSFEGPGGHRVYETVKFPLHDRKGRVYAIGGVSRDVTEARRASTIVAEARDAALAADAAKTAFLANMSHEIRTPMNAVIGMTDLLLESELDEQQREFVETVRNSGNALLSVINDVLDFSKIESGELHIDAEVFDVYDTVETTLDVVGDTARAKGLELLCDLDDAVPRHVVGDAVRLRQVLLNLLSNAVKFTKAGQVLLEVRSADVDGRVQLRLAVTDTGIGVSPEALSQLFESFSQVDASTTRKFGGSGLGLAITRRVAMAMGGGVSVTSEPDRGSTFTATLLVDPAPESMSEPSAPLPNVVGLRALVVDDNDTARDILARRLTALGLRCTTTDSPERAAALLSRGSGFRLVLVDAGFPAADIERLASAVDGGRPGSGPALVLVTPGAQLAPHEVEGRVTTLSTPVKHDQLREAVTAALGGTPHDVAGARPGVLVPDHKPMRILLAEDNPVNQRVAELMLHKLGHTVHTVPDGVAAVDAASHSSYDIVLMDVHMPEMDGLDATRQIRQHVRPADQPHIIAMTASVLMEDRKACAAAGMDSFLTKPVRAYQLQQALERVSESGPAGRRAS